MSGGEREKVGVGDLPVTGQQWLAPKRFFESQIVRPKRVVRQRHNPIQQAHGVCR